MPLATFISRQKAIFRREVVLMLGKKNVLLIGILVFALVAGMAFAYGSDAITSATNVTSTSVGTNTVFNISLYDNTLGDNITSIFINYSNFASATPISLSCGNDFTNSTAVPGANIINCTNSTGKFTQLNSTLGGLTNLSLVFNLSAPLIPNTSVNQYGISVTLCNYTNSNYTGTNCTSQFFGVKVTDAIGPVTYYVTPLDFINQTALRSAWGGISMTAAVNFGYTLADDSTAYRNCSLFTNSSGLFTFAWKASNSTPVSNGLNWINTTFADGVYNWSVKCYDAAENIANETNRTLKVETSLPTTVISYAVTNDTDLFYSTCSGNSQITVIVNTTGVGNLTMNATFTNASAAGAVVLEPVTLAMNYTMTNSNRYYYNATFTVIGAPSFVGVPIVLSYTDGLYTNGGAITTTPIIYNMTQPTGLAGRTTNLCKVTNFANITNLTFEKVGYGVVNFTDSVDMSTQTKAEKFAGLATAMAVDNKTIWINTTYFDYLNKNATLTFSALPFQDMPNLTYSAEGSTDVNACSMQTTAANCSGMVWTPNASDFFGTLSFSVTHFTNYSADGDAPVITASGPSGTQSSSSVIMALTTNEKAYCKYDATSTTFAAMTYTFSGGEGTTTHTQTLSLANGNYVYYVLCKDVVNNTMAVTTNSNVSFAVSVTASASGGGGGGGAAAPSEPTETQTVSGIQAGSSSTITLSNTGLAMTSLEITAAATIVNGQLTITQPAALPATISAVTGGTVYKYLSVSESGISETAISAAKIRFKVAKSWMADKGAGTSDIVLSRYADGKWSDLTTRQTNQDSNSYYFEADSPGLSTFAIKVVQAAAAPPTTPTGNETTGTTGGTGGTAATGQQGPSYITTVLVVLVLAIVAGGIWVYLKKQKEIGVKPWRKNVGFKEASK
jgi:PGF-pre-PGF domain-containing protein